MKLKLLRRFAVIGGLKSSSCCVRVQAQLTRWGSHSVFAGPTIPNLVTGCLQSKIPGRMSVVVKQGRPIGLLTMDQRGVTGLETAIILTAFMLVASVFAVTVLSTGILSR